MLFFVLLLSHYLLTTASSFEVNVAGLVTCFGVRTNGVPIELWYGADLESWPKPDARLLASTRSSNGEYALYYKDDDTENFKPSLIYIRAIHSCSAFPDGCDYLAIIPVPLVFTRSEQMGISNPQSVDIELMRNQKPLPCGSSRFSFDDLYKTMMV